MTKTAFLRAASDAPTPASILNAIQARFEWGRTHLDLASFASERRNKPAITAHLRQAHARFTDLQVPKYVERTAQLARAYSVTITEVEPEELTEGKA